MHQTTTSLAKERETSELGTMVVWCLIARLPLVQQNSTEWRPRKAQAPSQLLLLLDLPLLGLLPLGLLPPVLVLPLLPVHSSCTIQSLKGPIGDSFRKLLRDGHPRY